MLEIKVNGDLMTVNTNNWFYHIDEFIMHFAFNSISNHNGLNEVRTKVKKGVYASCTTLSGKW